MRLEYAPNVRIVKILCTGKIDAAVLLRAFEDGADAVYVAGCALGDCHFLEGNVNAVRTVRHAKHLLADAGIEPERLEFFHIPASAGPLFAEKANEMTDRARRVGPNPLRASARDDAGGKLAKPRDDHPPLPGARYGNLTREEQRDEAVSNQQSAIRLKADG